MTNTTAIPTRTITRWLGISSALVIAGAVLMGIEPPWVLRVIGSLLAWFGIVGLVYGFSISRPRPDSAQTLGEKLAMVSFVATALIGGYLFFTLQGLGWILDVESRLLTEVVVVMIAVTIVESILADILRRRETAAIVADERDASIRSRAASYAHSLLFVLLFAFVIHLGVGAPRTRVTSPVAIAHALICIMIVSELVRHAVEVWLYWRDRR